MPKFDQAREAEIIRVLGARGVSNGCPRCGQANFAIARGYVNHSIQDDLSGGLVLGGPSIPTAITYCTNCGFVSEHILGVLGLLPRPPERPQEKAAGAAKGPQVA